MRYFLQKNSFCEISCQASSSRIRKFVKTQFFFFTNTACVHTYPAYFPAVSGNFWKRSPEWKFFIRYEYVYVWTVVSGNFWIRFRHSLGSSLHGEHYKQTWRTASRVVASLLVALISSLISCVQINAAVIKSHNQYIRDRQDVLRLLFWMRPGRTSA